MTARYLRVRPHPSVGNSPVPLAPRRFLRAATCAPEGELVLDEPFIRRRVLHDELVIVAEGDAALPAAVEARAQRGGAA